MIKKNFFCNNPQPANSICLLLANKFQLDLSKEARNKESNKQMPDRNTMTGKDSDLELLDESPIP